MIYDFGTEVTAVFPPVGEQLTFSNSYDLAGGSDGVPALFGTGERLFMQFEITVAFVASPATAPRAMFGVAIDDTATLSTSSHILGLTGGSIGSDDHVGFEEDELTVGKIFHLPIPAWEDVMEQDAAEWPGAKTAATLATFRTLRYMGIVIYNPTVASTEYFTAGTVLARIVKDPSGTAVLSNIYGSRMVVK
jgi:hypothetical protein